MKRGMMTPETSRPRNYHFGFCSDCCLKIKKKIVFENSGGFFSFFFVVFSLFGER